MQIIWSCVVWFDSSCNVVKKFKHFYIFFFFWRKMQVVQQFAACMDMLAVLFCNLTSSAMFLLRFSYFFLSKCLIWIQIERSGGNLHNCIGRKWNYGRWKAVRIKTAIWRDKLNVCKTWKKKPAGIECTRKKWASRGLSQGTEHSHRQYEIWC